MSHCIHYQVEVATPHAHLFAITLTIPHPAEHQHLSLPVWIPGSYLIREFAQHLQALSAERQGQPVALHQLNKNTWQATSDGEGPLTVRYQVYAHDASVRTAFLDRARGFFNPTSLCLRVHGQEAHPHAIELTHTAHTTGWQVATALTAHHVNHHGWGQYHATNYDELADSPFELGLFWSGDFVAHGIPHRFIVSGATPSFDGERLLRDTQAVCESQIAFWHGAQGTPPFDRYVFLLHASQDGYGGLEHRQSTALICQRTDLPRLSEPNPADATTAAPTLQAGDGYTTLLGLISHEYFHTWKVKLLRPQEFGHYDYNAENYTSLLWFFEGFTSYYDDLFLLRSGLIDTSTHLNLLAKTINQVLQTPGRLVQSVAQASFDAWVKYYRQHDNTPNATISYYTKGALVALCLDLTLRAEGHTTLDEVMRTLYERCQAGPMSEDDLLEVLQHLGQRSYAPEIAAWVHGTTDLPLQTLLQTQGVQWETEPAPLAQRLGIRVTEAQGLHIKGVLRGSAAEAAGLAAGDEWIGVNTWRVKKLDDVALHAHSPTPLTALIARDGQLLHCLLDWPTTSHTVKLRPAPAP